MNFLETDIYISIYLSYISSLLQSYIKLISNYDFLILSYKLRIKSKSSLKVRLLPTDWMVVNSSLLS